jgi:hypothetical protein
MLASQRSQRMNGKRGVATAPLSDAQQKRRCRMIANDLENFERLLGRLGRVPFE